MTVAVLDTGIDGAAVDAAHRWLSGIAVHGRRDVLDSVPVPDGYLDDGAGHGTFVAGVLRQVASGVQVDMVRVLATDGLGTEFSVAEALFDLAGRAVAPQLVNLSLGCRTVDGVAPVALRAALDALRTAHPDTMLIAAAGNDGSTVASWPAAHPAVVSVGAAQGTRPANYSNHGPWVDFFVEVDGIVSAYVRGIRRHQGNEWIYRDDYAAWAGTSFAAPVITGLLAARLAAGMTPQQALIDLHAGSQTSPVRRLATIG